MTGAVAAVCDLFGLTEIAGDHPEEADLVLLDHSSWPEPIAARDLEFFRSSLGGFRKSVLRFHPATTSFDEPTESPSEGDHPTWLFQAPLASPQIGEVLRWIVSGGSQNSAPLAPPVDVGECRKLLARALGQNLAKLPLALLRQWLYFSIQPRQLVEAPTTANLYDLLLRLSADKIIYDHDVGKFLAQPLSPEAKRKLPGAIMAHRLRDVCEDLRLSLLNRLAVPRNGEPASILLIDDRPEDLLPMLQLLQLSLLAEFNLITWNPQEAELDKRTFDKLCTYRSVDRDQVKGLNVHVCSTSGGPSTSRKLGKLLPQLQFIVVDQLYRTVGPCELRGHDLIRGLARVLRDLGELDRIPEIIALSHTRSPDVINLALRAGARDYVEKSHLVALPGVLARIQRTVSEPAKSLHRNFSLLYKLPNEVIGCLRAAMIPWDKLGLHIEDDEATRRVYALLSAVPKTDLHLHVGSCMSAEFLVVASLVGLLQHKRLTKDHWHTVKAFALAVSSDSQKSLTVNLPGAESVPIVFAGGLGWISSFAETIRKKLQERLQVLRTELSADRDQAQASLRYRALRSMLHAELKLSDYASTQDVQDRLAGQVTDLDPWFGVRHLDYVADPSWLDHDTLIRLYILVLAARASDARLEIGEAKHDLLRWFRQSEKSADFPSQAWSKLRAAFFGGGEYALEELRGAGWRAVAGALPAIRLSLPESVGDGPIEWTVGTGTRSHNLREYLHGCEFSGSTHLKHPFLIHLYAQHLMRSFVQLGLTYVELRASPDGYVARDIGFGFADACACMVTALSSSQDAVVNMYLNRDVEIRWLPEILGSSEDWGFLALKKQLSAAGPAPCRRFPVKISLILVGKRHKGETDMMLEAAAGAVLHQLDGRFQAIAASKVLEECRQCRVVGFDLAGNEAEFPPGLFSGEFRRLSKLKIPITVHAGENASSRFVEDAIVELGAKRLGHGLSLADDKKLMALVREERICVELCPVSNHQTSHFTPPGESGRSYPLREFLSSGIAVCINTDNPIISRTDIVKEYFMASSAAGGLSLWDALRCCRTRTGVG